MTSLKEQIADEAALTAKVGAAVRSLHTDIIAATSEERATTKDARFRMIAMVVILIAGGGLLTQTDTPATSPALYIFLVSLVAIFFVGRNWLRAEADLATKLNIALLPALGQALPYEFKWAPEEMHSEETKAIFRESGLVTERVDSLLTDDMYSCKALYPVSFREVQATRREGSGKNSRTVTVFHGILVTVDLSKTLTATTYISTEGVKYGLAHDSFWSGVKEQGIEETILEWNEFEKDLHVASSDGIEARYILTPNFMADLYAWWQEGKENIRISFKGNRMILLLPDHKVRVNFSTTASDVTKLTQYLMSIAKPIWRTLTLVEDVRL